MRLISEDTLDLVRLGLARVERKRVIVVLPPERPRERLSVPNMDTSSIRHPLWQDGLSGVISTHGINPADREVANGQNHNNNVHLQILVHSGKKLNYSVCCIFMYIQYMSLTCIDMSMTCIYMYADVNCCWINQM